MIYYSFFYVNYLLSLIFLNKIFNSLIFKSLQEIINNLFHTIIN